MNQKQAQARLFCVQESYVKAIKAFEQAERFSRMGQTSKALAKRDTGMAMIRKAENAIADLDVFINEGK